MSDLQCPATVLMARHGETGQAAGDVGSQDGGGLSARGRGQVLDLVMALRLRRVAAVYSSAARACSESAELAACELGLRPVLLQGWQEHARASGEGVSLQDQRRFTETVGEIADLHRGETVLLITGGAELAATMGGFALNLRGDLAGRVPAHGAVAEVEVDADGWRLVSWPGGS